MGLPSIGWPAERTPSCFSTGVGVVSASRRRSCWTTTRFAIGVEGLKSFGHEGGSSRLTDEQEIALGDWVDAHCPQSIRKVGAWVRRTYELSYSRSGPETMPRGLDDAKQQAFINRYENLLNTMGAGGIWSAKRVFADLSHAIRLLKMAK